MGNMLDGGLRSPSAFLVVTYFLSDCRIRAPCLNRSTDLNTICRSVFGVQIVQ